jgi:TonB family protein
VVVFWVPLSGIPSHISIKSSSGSDALDSAAVNCVSKLRFASVTQLGGGEPVDSWQQVALSEIRRSGSIEPDRGREETE